LSRRFLTPVGLPSGATLPSVGSAGDLFYKSDVEKIYVHNGTSWDVVQGSSAQTLVSPTAPTDPNEGDTWFNSTNAKSYVYYDDAWIDVSVGSIGPAGPTGATGAVGPTGPTGPAGEGVTAMSLLTDVAISDLADGDVLLYSEAASKWVNVNLYQTLLGLGAVQEIDGGSYNTSAFAGTIDGGLYNTTEFASIVDGGNEGSF
jgi:hypothetical protein